MNKFEIAQILRDIGLLIELGDPLPQKGFAYRKAAHSIESTESFNEYLNEKNLESLPGIGKKIANIIYSIVIGQNSYYNELQKKVPITLLELVNIPGLNPRKVRILYEKLHITNIDDLKKALESDQLSSLKIFRPATLSKMKQSLQEEQNLLYPKAFLIAQGILNTLKSDKNIKKVELTGELRRKCELIHHLNFICQSSQPQECLDYFSLLPSVKEVLKKTDKEIWVLLKNGMKASLLVSSTKDFALDLLNSTGNDDHVSKVAKLSPSHLKTEQSIYSAIGLEYIPPEIREDKGEIEAARENKLPSLIEFSDLKGTFHCHTLDSDGGSTLEALVEAAIQLNWQYLGISDHSKASYQANGMDEERLFSQIQKIKSLNKVLDNFHLFTGIECDILKDGELDFTNDVLKELDFVIVSIHRRYKLNKAEMTQRLLKAIENPYTTIVGHLTGRLLRHRDPYEIDVEKVIDACIANGKIIELNCSPSRLDMDWRYWIKAKEKGLKCSIDPDAHSVQDLMYCLQGVYLARKGWLERKDVINTMSLKEMASFLKNLKSK